MVWLKSSELGFLCWEAGREMHKRGAFLKFKSLSLPLALDEEETFLAC